MLTLFVLNSGKKGKRVRESVALLAGAISQLVFVDSPSEILMENVDNEWFLVLYDNEAIDLNLATTIRFLIREPSEDIFSFMINGIEMQIQSRLFRKGVVPIQNFTIAGWKSKLVLDGWVNV